MEILIFTWDLARVGSMWQGRWRTAGLLVLCCCAPLATGAETLEDAWKAALAVDFGLQSSTSQVDAARRGLRSAQAGRLPTIDINSTYVGLTNKPRFDIAKGLGLDLPPSVPNPTAGGSPVSTSRLTSYSLGNRSTGQVQAMVTWPIFTGGTITGTIKAAGSGLDSYRWQRNRAELELKLAVAEAYVNVLRAQQATTISKEEVRTLAAHVHDVTDLHQHGYVPKNDLLAVQVSQAQAEERRMQVDNALELARSAYNRLMQRPFEQAVELAELSPPKPPQALATYTDQALVQRPELKALTSQAQALRHTARAIRGGLLPQVALVGGYTHIDMDALEKQNYGYGGVSVDWRIFDFGATRNRAGAANATSDSLRHQMEDARSLISLQVRQAWLDLNESLQRIKVTEQALHSADEDLKVTRDRYRSGYGTNTEVLDAETRRTGAYVNHNNAIYDAQYNELRLRQASGAL
jgi:outer membrane protein TolC